MRAVKQHEILVIALCTTCLRPFTTAGRTQCPSCGGTVRYTAEAIPLEQFEAMPDEEREWVKLMGSAA